MHLKDQEQPQDQGEVQVQLRPLFPRPQNIMIQEMLASPSFMAGTRILLESIEERGGPYGEALTAFITTWSEVIKMAASGEEGLEDVVKEASNIPGRYDLIAGNGTRRHVVRHVREEFEKVKKDREERLRSSDEEEDPFA